MNKPRFCQVCGYDLRGRIKPVCPECGEPFDPDETAFEKLGYDLRDVRLPVQVLVVQVALIAGFLLPAFFLSGTSRGVQTYADILGRELVDRFFSFVILMQLAMPLGSIAVWVATRPPAAQPNRRIYLMAIVVPCLITGALVLIEVLSW